MRLGDPDPRALRDAGLDHIAYGDAADGDQSNHQHFQIETRRQAGNKLAVVVPEHNGEDDDAEAADDGGPVFVGPPLESNQVYAPAAFDFRVEKMVSLFVSVAFPRHQRHHG